MATDIIMLRLLAVHVCGLNRTRWLTCKWEYSSSCSACKHNPILSIVSVRIWYARKRSQWSQADTATESEQNADRGFESNGKKAETTDPGPVSFVWERLIRGWGAGGEKDGDAQVRRMRWLQDRWQQWREATATRQSQKGCESAQHISQDASSFAGAELRIKKLMAF